jgi:hypothetical protein
MKKNYLLLLIMVALTFASYAQVEGTWKMSPTAQSLAVGPNKGDFSWWAIDDANVITRACFYDDEFKFNADGSFENVLGDDTWLEPWQGVAAEECGAPVAPHDGSAIASWAYDADAGTVTLTGTGAYLGLPKVHNAGELSSPNDAVAEITYPVEMSEDGMTMTIDIDFGGGWWHFVLSKEKATPTPVNLGGTNWKMSPTAQSLAVGPNKGDFSWWAIDDANVITRACFYDDEFKFNADGSFENVLGDDTWLEPWQGVAAEECGAPVAPHDGSAIASWAYDADAGTVTLTGTGAYLGLPKVHNAGELSSPNDAVAEITYPVEMSEDGMTMTIDIDFGGGWWHFVLAKEEDRSNVKSIDKNLFKVYPNPAKNEITVSSIENIGKVTIYDVTGKVMYTSNKVNANSTVNVSTFSRGVYMIEVMTDNKVSVKRLILD